MSDATNPPTAPGQGSQRSQPPAPGLASLDALATPPSSMAPATSGKGKKPVLTWVLGAIVAVGVLFGGGFFLGRATAPEPAGFGPGGGRGGFATGQMPGGGQASTGAEGAGGFGFVSGEVTAIDGDTVTVTAEDGSTTTVTTSEETALTHVTEGTSADLAVGDTVTVAGSSAESGDIAATSITEGDLGSVGSPMMRGGGGAGFPGGDFQGEGGFPDGTPSGFPGGAGQGEMPEGFPTDGPPAN
jgi:hypothetical protein